MPAHEPHPDAPRLFVLPPSHFCERARWALDHSRVGYREVPLAVGIHVPIAKRLAGGTSLPILDTGTEVIQGSDRILDWTGMKGGIPELEKRFEERIAPLVRQYLYSSVLTDVPSQTRELLLSGVPKGQARLARLAWPLIRRVMIAGMNAKPSLTARLEGEMTAELDWFERQLGTRRHFAGDRFGRADLTAASLLAPLAQPPECPIYRRADLPPVIADALDRWSRRPSIRWVLDTYAGYRSSVAVTPAAP